MNSSSFSAAAASLSPLSPIVDGPEEKKKCFRLERINYGKYNIYWQASNTAVHYVFISRGRGPPPDLFPLAGGETPTWLAQFCSAQGEMHLRRY
jgi:hypothetical protein